MTKIVFLETDTITTGDLDINQFDTFKNAILLNTVDGDNLFKEYSDVEILLINKTQINSSVLDKLPDLKFIQIMATGYDNVDLESCRKRGVTVCNVEGYSTYSVAQHVFSLILSLTNKVHYHWQMSREGIWSNEPKFTFYTPAIPELHHKTLGIIGLGSIGSRVAQIGKAFGMDVITFTRSPEKINDADIRSVDLDELARTADIISLHLPLSQDTTQIIDRTFLSKMKESAYLINTARGGLINEQDLHDTLIVKGIKGAGLDVLSIEPPPIDHLLFPLPNCIITSHMAWATLEARRTLLEKSEYNIENYRNNGSLPHSLT